MFGPYLITCEDCDFEAERERGADAQTAAEAHRDRHDHATSITAVTTDATITLGE